MKTQIQIYCTLKNCVNLKEGSAPSAACASQSLSDEKIQPFDGCSNHHAEAQCPGLPGPAQCSSHPQRRSAHWGGGDSGNACQISR